MDSMDNFRARFEALEQQTEHLRHQTQALEAHTRTVERRLRWWRGLACGLVVPGLVGLPLYEVKTQAQAPEEADAPEEVEAQARTLEQRVAALESKLRFVTRSGRNIFITGANLHIRNGLRSTDCTNEQGNSIPNCPNGRSNLIVGYNEPRAPGDGANIRTGSHNVVVGQGLNFSSFGGLVVGLTNTISGIFSSVTAGQFNTASGDFSSVSGGDQNTASGDFASVTGGTRNKAMNFNDTVTGGESNTANGRDAVVSGGKTTRPSRSLPSSVGGSTGRQQRSSTGRPVLSSRTFRRLAAVAAPRIAPL